MGLISLDLLDRFLQSFTPYECALCADDGSVAFFQFIKGRCHGNQIILRKCINIDWYPCIRSTRARKRIAISWSSYAH